MVADAPAFALPPLVGDWLLTYLGHSTLLLGGAWLASRLARRLPAATQEALWRSALFGALLTASVQVALGYESVGGRVAVPAAPPLVVDVAPAPLPLVEHVAPVAMADEVGTASAEAAAPPLPTGASRLDRLPLWLALLWSAGAALTVVRSMRARRRLQARLARRTPVEVGPLRETLDRLAPAGSVRLSVASDLAGPVAFGIRRREICLPERATHDLTAAQQEAMLAHECAHHHRRDPLWLALGRAVQSLFFFQPLNALAVRRLRDTGEVLCDAWAVARTGQRRALAECLAVVAEWMVVPRSALPVPAMAHGRSSVEQRVRALLDTRRPARPTRVAGLVVAALPLLLVTALAPAIGGAASTPSTPVPPETAPVDDLDAALAALDAEIEALAREVDALVRLVTEAGSLPHELTVGVARLQARLVDLRAERAALIERIRIDEEPGR